MAANGTTASGGESPGGSHGGTIPGQGVCPRCREEFGIAAFYEPPLVTGRHYPKVQILTIAELLGGKELEYPKLAPATFKKAPPEVPEAGPERAVVRA